MSKEQRRAFGKAMLDYLLKSRLLDSGEYSEAIDSLNERYKENKATMPFNNVAIEPLKSDVCNEQNKEDQGNGKR